MGDKPTKLALNVLSHAGVSGKIQAGHLNNKRRTPWELLRDIAIGEAQLKQEPVVSEGPIEETPNSLTIGLTDRSKEKANIKLDPRLSDYGKYYALTHELQHAKDADTVYRDSENQGDPDLVNKLSTWHFLKYRTSDEYEKARELENNLKQEQKDTSRKLKGLPISEDELYNFLDTHDIKPIG